MKIPLGILISLALALGSRAVSPQIGGQTPSVASQVETNQHATTKEKPRVAYQKNVPTAFRTSDRCIACHVGMKTAQGEDYSIGFDWRASIMANSSRDPYWQGSIRRETLDHPQAKQRIENDCSFCHMAAVRLADRDANRDTHVFERFPFLTLDAKTKPLQRAAQDGVTCSVCHQVEKEGLGTDATFNGNVVVSKAVREDERPEYGPYDPDHGHQTVMHSSTGGYLPAHSDHIRDAALCASCHTLYTEPMTESGVKLPRFPEQMPYQEWQHSDYAAKQTCQQCHMPAVDGPTPVTALYGQMRDGARRHVFVGSNFVMEGMLQDHRDDLKTVALPAEMDAAMARTKAFLQTQAAKVSIERIDRDGSNLSIDVLAVNLSGHKLPTAYPSRRAWLHVKVIDAAGNVLFESGAQNSDGSIVGNDNDENPLKYEPHWREITNPQQVEIYEPILLDEKGQVTTGLLYAARYAKDNRLLPSGFDKNTAAYDVAVVGDAQKDPGFTDKGSKVRYVVSLNNATGPYRVVAELCYQPIGYRWAHNLEPYKAAEPQRLVEYYGNTGRPRTVVLATAKASK